MTLSGGKLFTKLNMSHAYQQLLLDKDSKEYVTINKHKGLFKYNCLVFRVASSPGSFQRMMDTLLQVIPHVAVYLNNILITGAIQAEHRANLEWVLQKPSDAGLRLKCIVYFYGTYLGHEITAEELCPVKDKVHAIKDGPSPKSVTELRSFLEMVNYYVMFLPDLSKVLALFYKLLQADTK